MSLRARAFTIFELLAVITLLAVLLTLLLPSLKSARITAHKAVCLSNLHQIGIMLTTYAVNDRYPPYITTANGGLFYLSNGSPGAGNITGYKISWMDLILDSVPSATIFDCPAKKVDPPAFNGSWSSSYPLPADYPFPQAIERNYAYNASGGLDWGPRAFQVPSHKIAVTDGWIGGGEVYGYVTGAQLFIDYTVHQTHGYHNGDFAYPHHDGDGINVLYADAHSEHKPWDDGLAGAGSIYDYVYSWQVVPPN